MRRALKHISFFILAIVMSFLFVEVSARVYVRFAKQANPFETMMRNQGVYPGKKADGEKRIFLVGESAVRGFPFTIDLSLTGYFQHLVDSSEAPQIRVLNAGLPGQNTFFLRRGLPRLLKYEPDAVIIYSGNNDARAPKLPYVDNLLSKIDLWLVWRSEAYRILRNPIRVAASWLRLSTKRKARVNPAKPIGLPPVMRTDAEQKKIDDEIKTRSLHYFEENLEAMALLFKKAGVEVYLATLPIVHESIPFAVMIQNLAFNPNFEGKEDDSTDWGRAIRAGRVAMSEKKYATAYEYFQKADGLRPQNAATEYWMGRSLQALGRLEEARTYYIKAKDDQALSPGGDTLKNSVIRKVAERNKLHLIDLNKKLEAASPGEILGATFFIDHCHLNLKGQRIVASVFYEALCLHGFLSCKPGTSWLDARDRLEEVDWILDNQNKAQAALHRAYVGFSKRIGFGAPDYADVLENLESVVDTMPENPMVYYLMAPSYWYEGEPENALKALEKLNELSPADYQRAISDFPYLKSLGSVNVVEKKV